MPQNVPEKSPVSDLQYRELAALKAELIRLKIKLDTTKRPHRNSTRLPYVGTALLNRYGSMIPDHLILRLLQKLPAKRKYRLLGGIALFLWQWQRERQRYAK